MVLNSSAWALHKTGESYEAVARYKHLAVHRSEKRKLEVRTKHDSVGIIIDQIQAISFEGRHRKAFMAPYAVSISVAIDLKIQDFRVEIR